jgi:hypothetical protein
MTPFRHWSQEIRTSTTFFVVLLIGATAGCAIATAEPDNPDKPFLDVVAEQIGLPPQALTVSGTHTAKGYVSAAAQATNAVGMQADCDNINLNKKLAADFRSDVFGPGVNGFFFKCEKIASDTNKYWFTISSADRAQIDKVCDPATASPIVYDQQHDTYWLDEPFSCTGYAG